MAVFRNSVELEAFTNHNEDAILRKFSKIFFTEAHQKGIDTSLAIHLKEVLPIRGRYYKMTNNIDT